MKSILLSTLLILVLVSCTDEESPTAPKDDKVTIMKGMIKGYVFDSATDLPVSGAIISTFPITSTTRSDENGKFELPEISPDLYDLNIKHKNYFAYTSKIKVSDQITNNIELFITSMESVNTKPEKPTLLFPSEDFKVSTNKIKFRWEGNDIDNDSLLYDVYFRKMGSDFKSIANNLKSKYYDDEFTFSESEQYQWYVIAKDYYSFSISDTFNFTYKEVVLTDIEDMIGNWKFDGDATDYAPNAYISSMDNVTFVNDRRNNFESAANFFGKSSLKSKVLLPTSLQLRNEFTISLWIKPLASLGENGAGYYDCISKWGGSGSGKASWAFGITKNSNLFLSTYNTSLTTQATTTIIFPDEWQHIAVTFINGTATFYINGAEVHVATGMQTPQISGYNASIGARPDQLSSYHGAMDDVYLFDRALSDQEILSLSQE
ncbi:MAG: LamG-like jellyroll fold domain-containing protein [Candidatus Kapaibacterium sp.]